MRYTRPWRGAVRCGAARCSERDWASCAGGLMMGDGKVSVGTLSISTRTGVHRHVFCGRRIWTAAGSNTHTGDDLIPFRGWYDHDP
jgi:hypothetical protein